MTRPSKPQHRPRAADFMIDGTNLTKALLILVVVVSAASAATQMQHEDTVRAAIEPLALVNLGHDSGTVAALFEAPEMAAQATMAFLLATQKASTEHDEKLLVRASLHRGCLVWADGRFGGTALKVAEELAANASGGDVWVSREAHVATRDYLATTGTQPVTLPISGRGEIRRVDWSRTSA